MFQVSIGRQKPIRLSERCTNWSVTTSLESNCDKGLQIGQSFRVQRCQWQVICLDEEQWGSGHDFSNWHDVIWMSTSFMYKQLGKGHCGKKIISKSGWQNYFPYIYCKVANSSSTVITLTCLINVHACLVHSYVLSKHARLLGRWDYLYLMNLQVKSTHGLNNSTTMHCIIILASTSMSM